ncbi:PTS glucitol/sorbitol transporter subunit IIA [Latilactobacillus curvatus]|uniref:PTS glucitol/sorbitol transporter subunit IIA n=1 Tax=Latilactobacillus curvatus TaxID=28038 RepID=UPI0011BAE954|nr:PTS glucitol/sorbitol transporter subunit IIA [Latilactobacillus curvatus]QEA49293.1 PTS sorbitol transporter subunit IIA [Latilactobacillus curvatus]WBY48510.1 PTS glucitol/sorbitol transporter subunit IIA [Latilactobacillus curvatus]WIE00492.1 PTS glucitol/sorbitol transporter subunit IIA [Latilactobacillus curvatus]
MNTQAEVISIGNDAIDDQEPMVILFDEHATTAIQNVALIQHFMDEAAKKQLTLTTDSAVIINQQPYTITYVGALVNPNLNSIGHVALVFGHAPQEDQLQSGLYLTPAAAGVPAVPEFKVGTQITYQETM